MKAGDKTEFWGIMWKPGHSNITVEETLRLFLISEGKQEPHVSHLFSIYTFVKQTGLQAAGITTLQLLWRTHLHFIHQWAQYTCTIVVSVNMLKCAFLSKLSELLMVFKACKNDLPMARRKCCLQLYH